MSGSELQEWLETEMGLLQFVEEVRAIVGVEEYEQLLKWVSRPGPHPSADEIEQMEARLGVLRELLERWEPIVDPEMARSIAGQVEF